MISFFFSLNQGLHQSRACGACDKADPHPRFFSSACHHAVCRDCANNADVCPSCNEPTSFVRIFDDEPYVCPICDLVTPGLGVFANCGHMACGICAIRFAAQADDLGLNSPRCPFCQASSHCCPIRSIFVPCSMTNEVDRALDCDSGNWHRNLCGYSPAIFIGVLRMNHEFVLNKLLSNGSSNVAARNSRSLWSLRRLRLPNSIAVFEHKGEGHHIASIRWSEFLHFFTFRFALLWIKSSERA